VPQSQAPRRIAIFLVTGAAVVTQGCKNEDLVQPTSAITSYAKSGSLKQPTPFAGSLRDQYEQLAAVAPGFAEVFFDKNGELTIAVATDSFSSTATENVLTWARAYSRAASSRTSARLRRVKYGYLTLSSNYRVVLRAIQREDSARATAIDGSAGKISIGLASLRSVEQMRQRFADSGVPADMVHFEQVGPAIPQTTYTLNQTNPKKFGGLEIRIHIPGTYNDGACTLGLNVYKGNQQSGPDPSQGRFFLTASHCFYGEKGDTSRPNGFSLGRSIGLGSSMKTPRRFTTAQRATGILTIRVNFRMSWSSSTTRPWQYPWVVSQT